MLSYLARRLTFVATSVFGISFVAFVAFGSSLDPTYPLALGGADNPKRIALQHQFHLTDPILQRYWLWLSGLFSHGFGRTVMGPRLGTGGPIGPALGSAAAVTAELVASSVVIVVLVSVLVGTSSAMRPGSPLDIALRMFAYVAWSVPTVALGALLAVWLGPTGWFESGPIGGGFVSWIRHMALPILTLSLGLIGLYSRYIRTAMIVSLNQPYAVVARAKGLPERSVVLRHALRNSLIPFVILLSVEFAAVIGASLAADYIFGIGGLASLFLSALGAADPFELTALIVVLSGTVASFMLLADLVVGRLDPRMRIE